MGSDIEVKIGESPGLNMKKVLCIVPLSPPVTGPALASETIINYLKQRHDVVVISYQRGNLISGRFSLRQLFKIFAVGIRLKLIAKHFDSVYLVVSSSFWGNLRDLFFLIVTGKKLRKKTILHLHGTNVDRHSNTRSLWRRYLNRRLLRDVRDAIVLGETFNCEFDGYIPGSRIQIVKNFVQTDVFIEKEKIRRKYEYPDEINILFLSNLIENKGYKILLNAFLSLDDSVRNKAMLHFAGNIDSEQELKLFNERIEGISNIVYHGPVVGDDKQNLLWDAHVFCLPVYYKFEGQPISILEAYASGCIVLTTKTGGISDIFVNNENGFWVEMEDVKSLRQKLEMVILNIDKYRHIAKFNFEEASEKYAEERFCKDIEEIITNNHTRLCYENYAY